MSFSVFLHNNVTQTFAELASVGLVSHPILSKVLITIHIQDVVKWSPLGKGPVFLVYKY